MEFCIPESDGVKPYEEEFPPLGKKVLRSPSQKVVPASDEKYQPCIKEPSREKEFDAVTSKEMSKVKSR